ncbi:MAG: hypothetical protein K8H87_02720 [Pseudorhodoplanes sp.]|nr:hypothetical protein [Pseudorhodoplanes sp.]
MLTLNDLKNWLHRDLSREDKALLILGSMGGSVQVQAIKSRARDAGFSAIEKWNVSSVLSRTKGLALNTPSGWELSDRGKQHLRALGVSKISAAAVQVATDLRRILNGIEDEETRKFVEEAVQCYEYEFYRSAVVMSWAAAVHVLKLEVLKDYLCEFNAEAAKCYPKWKPAKSLDDIGLMRERDFLDRIAKISVIGTNTKEQLQGCLKLRNACGHPSLFRLGPNAVANHLEILILNVFQKFAR